jgi:hypothetical protein
MSTVSPAASARVAGALEATGCLYLRAPVSGSTALAEKGALSMYRSGPREAFERCEPTFSNVFVACPTQEVLPSQVEHAHAVNDKRPNWQRIRNERIGCTHETLRR